MQYTSTSHLINKKEMYKTYTTDRREVSSVSPLHLLLLLLLSHQCNVSLNVQKVIQALLLKLQKLECQLHCCKNNLVICSKAMQQVAVIKEKTTAYRPALYLRRDFCISHWLQVCCAQSITVICK